MLKPTPLLLEARAAERAVAVSRSGDDGPVFLRRLTLSDRAVKRGLKAARVPELLPRIYWLSLVATVLGFLVVRPRRSLTAAADAGDVLL